MINPFATANGTDSAPANGTENATGVTERPQRILLRVSTYNLPVKKKVRIFSSFEEADEADARDYMAMTPEQRIQIVIELRDRRHPDAAKQGLARVCRVIKREQS